MDNPQGIQDTTETITPDAGAQANPADGLTAEPAAASSVPDGDATQIETAPQGANQNLSTNQPGGKQPESIGWEQVAKAIGPIRAEGKELQIRDAEHLRRLVQQGYGANAVSAKAQEAEKTYTALRQPYEWLNEQLSDPSVAKMFKYARHQSGFLQHIAKQVDQWEQQGHLNPQVVEHGMTKMELDQYKSQFQSITEQQEQAKQQQAEQTEVQEVHGLVNEVNAGIPFTQAQLGKVKIYRDGLRAQGGNYATATYADALRELVAAGEWVKPKAPPMPATGPTGKPPQRQNVVTTDDPEEFRSKFREAAGW